MPQPEIWDALVVGAGPAGAMAALELARRGVAVLLVEKRQFPRWKVCGCCLNGQAQAVLTAAGQAGLIARQGGVPLQQLRLSHRNRQTVLALPGGQVLSRERLDQALVEAAQAAGAAVRTGITARLGAVDGCTRQVLLQEHGSRRNREVRARVVLVAAGLAQRCIPAAEGGSVRIRPQSRLGAGCLLPGEPNAYRPGVIHMAVAEQGYVGLVQREDGQLNLAAAFDRQALQAPGEAARRVLTGAGFPIPAGLEQAHWQCTPALSRRATAVAGPRFLVLGDAAGYVEPFTGEGMAWALAAGAAAAPLALEGLSTWSTALEHRWQRTLRQRVGRRQWTCRALALLLRQPSATALALAISQWQPTLAQALVAQLNQGSAGHPALQPCP